MIEWKARLEAGKPLDSQEQYRSATACRDKKGLELTPVTAPVQVTVKALPHRKADAGSQEVRLLAVAIHRWNRPKR